MSKPHKKAQADEAQKKIDVQAATLVGNMRDEFLTVFKNHADWKKMPEAKQRDVAASCESLSKELVRRATRIIAGRGFKFINGTVKQITVKDGLKVVIEANQQSEFRNDLVDSQGGAVTLVLSDIAAYMANRSEPDIDEDEPALPGVGKKK